MGTKQIRELLAGIVNADAVKDDETLFMIGISSMEISRFLSRLHQDCNIDVSFADFYKNSSISELSRFINTKYDFNRGQA
ncbi:MAG TPA: hypothetical protein DCG49_03230 [Ruminococcus sp.]|nr:hypothetical protein [Ruminococcus sp.]